MTFDLVKIGKQVPKVFTNKAKFRSTFYDELLRNAPNLAGHFEDNGILQSDMIERFMGELIKTAVGGQSISRFANAFLEQHKQFELTPRDFDVAQEAFLKAYEVSTDHANSPNPEAHMNWLLFIQFIFNEFQGVYLEGDYVRQ